MRRILPVILLIGFLFQACTKNVQEISLSGDWKVKLDAEFNPDNTPVSELKYEEDISLPSTLDEAGIGKALDMDTLLTKEVMTHLMRKVSYIGPAYYSREINIPASWEGKVLELELERVLWKSTVWIDDKEIGEANSLSTLHRYIIKESFAPGKHRLTICVDNRRQVEINPSDMAHAYTNHTQIKWNGILGNIKMRALPEASIDQLIVFPDAKAEQISGLIQFRDSVPDGGAVRLFVKDVNDKIKGETELDAKGYELSFDLKMTEAVVPWSEQTPEIYTLVAELVDKGGKQVDLYSETFGFRKVEIGDGNMILNGKKIFLRGTLECSIFPLTGHPPLEKEEWISVLSKAKNYGLNHLRFHSWCPPEAAFEAADEMGFYLQVELPNWILSYGSDPAVVDFIEKEADRIIREYGNHPSFLMFCMGNEVMGDFDRLNALVRRLKAKDNRHLYAATAFTFQKGHGGFHEPFDDYYITQWTDSGWVRGQGVFDEVSPSFNNDYEGSVKHIDIPVISHEIGQYTVYPNLAEIEKYTGVLTPLNFLAVKKDLEDKGRLDLAPLYTEATGKFATILYKEEIERAYKTPGLNGFQLLDLHDFPGQGTALVGILDAFWDSKGFTSGEEFRQFCSPVVPLLWFEKAIYLNTENFMAEAGLSNYSGDLYDVDLEWTVSDDTQELQSGIIEISEIPDGSVIKAGRLDVDLSGIEVPAVLKLQLHLKGTNYRNSWNIWVYEDVKELPTGQVAVTGSYSEAVDLLKDGRKVLLSPPLNEIQGIDGKFVPVFWSPVHFPDQPGTMGILCDPDHPVFNMFPSEFHSDWQWWDISKGSITMEIDSLDVKPLITVMDNFFKNRELTNLFEARIGEGTLIFSSIDLLNLEGRPAATQLKRSILSYMNSDAFTPKEEIVVEELLKLRNASDKQHYNTLSIYR